MVRADAQLFRRAHNRRAVRIVRADVVTLVAPGALKAHPDVGLHLFEHMPEVQRAVRVGQGAGHENAPPSWCHSAGIRF